MRICAPEKQTCVICYGGKGRVASLFLPPSWFISPFSFPFCTFLTGELQGYVVRVIFHLQIFCILLVSFADVFWAHHTLLNRSVTSVPHLLDFGNLIFHDASAFVRQCNLCRSPNYRGGLNWLPYLTKALLQARSRRYFSKKVSFETNIVNLKVCT